MMKSGRKGISYIECKGGIYHFLEEKSQIPEKYKTYEYIDLSACDSMDDLLSAVLDNELNEMVLAGQHGADTLLQQLSRKLADADKELTVTIILEEEQQSRKESGEEALAGLTALITGNYADADHYQKPKQVFLEDSKLLERLEVCDQMDLNGEIFLPLSKYNETSYAKWKEQYYNHIYFIGENKLWLDGCEQSVPLAYGSFASFASCSAWKQESGYKSINYIELEKKEDYEKLILELQYFTETGKIRNPYFYLKNECRWSERCNLPFQRRMQIHSEQSVSICEPSQKFKWEPDSYRQYEDRQKAMEQAKQERGCKHCSVAMWCTKCSGLSTDGTKLFCNTMQNHMEMIDFIQIKNVYMELGQFDIKCSLEDVSFSCYGHTILLPPDMTGKKLLTHQQYLCKVQEMYYCLSAIKKTVTELEEQEAFVMELILKGYSFLEGEQAFSKVYKNKDFSCLWEKTDKLLQR